ncbi:glycosyl hydrolase family 3 N terminal domain-containing protein [Colletotrichum karsti]|uniref:beta-glucosidase n=1 Tax=Colletotrichum karsti TaxID=1095194 RepID=A0A9P6HY88_9PEZI|nr:glycosyl hydrolase family 3 N terminal domain-containing protein [Colletotrichum karsti]KAF9873033.1 glycosyl hydrolase family 3 N terminal domain-containing protein [Colletotrichum karsti]
MVNAMLSTAVAVLAGLQLCAAQSQYTNETDPYYGQSPPVYPSPVGNGTSNDAWASAYQRAKALAVQMTVEELANFTHGWTGLCTGNTGSIPRLGIEPLCLQDGPDGVRAQEFVSAFPAGIHLGATWDKNLSYAYGEALGAEYRGKGINIGLGPVGGPLGRIARGGRNWEGLSNDPYLSAIGVGGITKGMQDAGTIACPKHWILNEQEYRRNPEAGIGEAASSNVDDRTLHELYVFPFMDALREGAASVMCSYQRSNNSYGCQNSKLLNGVLKGELGFEGFVVSDWGAQHSGVGSANAGLDLTMPSEAFWGASLVESVNNGSVTRERVEDMTTRILAAWFYTGQDADDYPAVGTYSNLQKHEPVDVQNGHKALIREIGAAGTVLVKNFNGTLPLKSPKFLTVYGYDAALPPSPWASTSYGPGFGTGIINTYNGTIIAGGGSGITTPPYVISPFQAIQDRVISDGGIIKWDFYSENPSPPYVNTEACIVFINAWASEGYDRPSLTDEFSDNLVNNVAANCPNTIVVLHSAGTRVVDAWVDHPNVTALIFAGLPGQESGHSLVDILYGDVNPSGRLPYTVAHAEEDFGALLNSSAETGPFPQDDFTEGLFIDYRAFEKDGISPRYEFGFGLSYTTFEYSALSSSAVGSPVAGVPDASIAIVQGGHPQLWEEVYSVTAQIQNTGGVGGHEVAQLYVGIPVEGTPAKQLRGFERVYLEAGASATVEFSLTRRDLSVWDVVAQQWRLAEGEYDVWVGASSLDLRLNGTFTI